MARYVDAEEFLKDLHNSKILFKGTYAQGILFFGLFDRIIRRQPTADVAEVVRCKDCKHYNKELMNCYNNEFPFHCESRPIMRETDYCSYGERRTE